MDNIPTWVGLLISGFVAIFIAITVQLFLVPWQRKKILGQIKSKTPVTFSFEDSNGNFFPFSMN